MSEIEYQPLFLNIDITLYGCKVCGALVRNTARHDKWHADMENHGHSYAACYGPGGQWDRTGGMTAANERSLT
jgi:hypothetical protein